MGIQHIFDAVELKNKEAFEKLLKEAIALALGLFVCSVRFRSHNFFWFCL